MKLITSKWFPWALAGVLLFLLLYVGCDRNNEKEDIKTETKLVDYKLPEVSDSIVKPTKIEEIPIGETDSVKIGNNIIYISSPINPILKQELEKTKNAYKTLLEETRKREYSQDFVDENVSVHVATTVFGRLDSTKITYKIPQKTIKIPQTTTTITKTIEKKDNFSWIAGGGANKNLQNQKINFEANAGIRVKDLIILGSINTDKQVGAKVLIQF